MRRISIFPVSRKSEYIALWPAFLLTLIMPSLAEGAGPYEISWSTIDGGGGRF